MSTAIKAQEAPAPFQQPWRERDGRTVLLAARLAGRHGLHFPPLPPTSPLLAGGEIVEIDSTPTLYSFTVVHASPKAGKPPMALGLADFPEGLRVFGRLVYPEGRAPRIGDRLSPCVTQADDGLVYAFELRSDEA
ncbi:Zn-ribbon domain-containing OB-fold protein [Variovorax sp. OV329]|uniref:Zn-ribbon domain-containing OB-fold protein n=1 Tax=Variovorax sp. OV329 TaxID=1882825 RepID=UPI0008EB474A|nr:OB-fold domain-containing protein [Variovorax sp. OV329]SFN02736.1 DUF35 OB-fold domain-containing protein, acyl-CoA-associated [Variovorax sp. OV329]